MRSAVVIERAEKNWSAYVPDLPGCVATGSSVEQAEDRIRVAIAMHLEGLREDGEPIPPRAVAWNTSTSRPEASSRSAPR